LQLQILLKKLKDCQFNRVLHVRDTAPKITFNASRHDDILSERNIKINPRNSLTTTYHYKRRADKVE